jgi:hypothetical protein
MELAFLKNLHRSNTNKGFQDHSPHGHSPQVFLDRSPQTQQIIRPNFNLFIIDNDNIQQYIFNYIFYIGASSKAIFK